MNPDEQRVFQNHETSFNASILTPNQTKKGKRERGTNISRIMGV